MDKPIHCRKATGRRAKLGNPFPRFYLVLIRQPIAPMEADGISRVYQMYPPKCYKTPEHLFRLSPRQTLFRSCRGLFRGTFCNFATRNSSNN